MSKSDDPIDEVVMPVYLYIIDSHDPITYCASNYVKGSVDLEKKDIIGFAVREKGRCLDAVSSDVTEFMDAVEEQAIAVRWFDESIRSELERNDRPQNAGAA